MQMRVCGPLDFHWFSVADKLPAVDLEVLVTDGEEIKIDKRIYTYRIDGRVLLPSDPRRRTTVPHEEIWNRYVNITHWMPLPAAPTP